MASQPPPPTPKPSIVRNPRTPDDVAQKQMKAIVNHLADKVEGSASLNSVKSSHLAADFPEVTPGFRAKALASRVAVHISSWLAPELITYFLCRNTVCDRCYPRLGIATNHDIVRLRQSRKDDGLDRPEGQITDQSGRARIIR